MQQYLTNILFITPYHYFLLDVLVPVFSEALLISFSFTSEALSYPSGFFSLLKLVAIDFCGLQLRTLGSTNSPLRNCPLFNLNSEAFSHDLRGHFQPFPHSFSSQIASAAPAETICALDNAWGNLHTFALPGTSSSHLQLLKSCATFKVPLKRHLLCEAFVDFPGSPISPLRYWKQLPLVQMELTFLYRAASVYSPRGKLMEAITQGKRREPKFFALHSSLLITFQRHFLTLEVKGLVLSIFVTMVSSSGPRTKECSKKLLVI